MITGSTRGIRRPVAEACAREGEKPVICLRQESAAKQMAETSESLGFRASGIRIDVSSLGDLERLFKHTLGVGGGIDIWANNAGFSGGFRPLDEMRVEGASHVVDVNVKATINARKTVLPCFAQLEGEGAVNTRTKGVHGETCPYTAACEAIKAPASSLIKSIAREYREYLISIRSIMQCVVAMDLRKDMNTSPKLVRSPQDVPYVLRAIGTSPIQIASQQLGKNTRRNYSPAGKLRMVRGNGMLLTYWATGEVHRTN